MGICVLYVPECRVSAVGHKDESEYLGVETKEFKVDSAVCLCKCADDRAVSVRLYVSQGVLLCWTPYRVCCWVRIQTEQ